MITREVQPTRRQQSGAVLRAAWQCPFDLDIYTFYQENTQIKHMLERAHTYTVKKVVLRAAWQRPFDLHDAPSYLYIYIERESLIRNFP
jgi:hypothetical protein